MLDASKYAQHFPDENHHIEAPAPTAPSPGLSHLAGNEPPVPRLVAPSPSLLAALIRLEREFEEILRTQQAEPTSRRE